MQQREPPSTQSGATQCKPQVGSVAIELTAICNQRCDYCYNAWREDGGKAIGGPEVDALLARVGRLVDTFDIDHVTLTGGEPLVHPGFFDVARMLREQDVGVQVISNGTLVSEEVAAKLASLKLRFIQLTLNGPDETMHSAHVGKGFFDKTIAGAQRLRAHGVPVVGCIVITKKNAPVVDRILALWQSLGARSVALSRFSPAGYAARHAAQLLPSVDDLELAFALADPFGERMGLQCTMPVPPCALDTARFTNIRFGVCPIGTAQQEFALGPDGKLRNCTLHGAAIGGVPDIIDPQVDLAALLHAPEVSEYRELRPEFCAGCVHIDTCGGGCGAAADWVLGSRRQVDPLVAQHTDDDFSDQLAMFRRNGKTYLEMVL